MSLPSSFNSFSHSSPVSFEEDALQGWPHPDDYIKTFAELKQYCIFDRHGSNSGDSGFGGGNDDSQDSWSGSSSGSSSPEAISPPPSEEQLLDPVHSAFNAPLSWTSLELPKLGGRAPGVNYYPNFDPKEYFCDTIAVDNASMVAQIVGKKGAKIKHLVAKYGIRIRTPNMDQEPVFVIRGKRADVYSVKQEIQSAAAHFMRIEEIKQGKLNMVMNSNNASSLKLFIPTRYVGLVIGRNGRIVRELQTTHNVHIETPKFDIRQFFVIYGSTVSIELALKTIYDLLVKKSGVCFNQMRKQPDEMYFTE